MGKLLTWNIDIFKAMHLYEGKVAQAVLWIPFLFFAVGVIFASKYMSEYLVAWTARKKIKQSVAGALILATVTSLPETTIALTMGASGFPQQSFANTIGGNSYYLFLFALISLIFIRRQSFIRVNKWNRILLMIGLSFSCILFLTFIPQHFTVESLNALRFLAYTIPGINISWVLLLFALSYILTIFFFLRQNKKEPVTYDKNLIAQYDEEDETTEKELKNHLTIKQLLIFFIVAIVVLVSFSFCLSLIMGVVPHTYHIPETSAGGLLLSFVTNMPETISTFTLLKMGKNNIAFGGLVGSILYNNVINFFGDIAFQGDGVLNHIISHDQDYLQYFMLTLMQFVLIVLTRLTIQRQVVRHRKIYIFLNLIIILIFISIWAVNLTVIAAITPLP
ncbi:sodium:calcium antiporter [Spiroplasma sp. DGKH1]|uniref:sodium:calcium antiporter n=1 Tax=Spiroplasma sp. DGKH1 TaxID=3050074 RepID=UPI0034C5CD1B